MPPLPEGRRLVSPAAYALPPPAPAVKEGVVERCFGAGPPVPTQAPDTVVMSGGAAAAGTAAGAAAGTAAGPSPGKAAAGEEQGCSCCRCVAGSVGRNDLWC